MLELKNTKIDSAEISIVPLGGRHVNHFWRLLNDLKIPFITLLDLDRERNGGGWGRIKYAIKQLIANGHDKNDLLKISKGGMDDKQFEDMNNWDVTEVETMDEWIKMLENYDIYFSSPLDIDFSMLTKFKEKYIATLSSNEGPFIKGYGKIQTPEFNEGEEDVYKEALDRRIQSDLRATLKEEGGKGATYDCSEKELMIWYNYFFLNRGKPTTHCKSGLWSCIDCEYFVPEVEQLPYFKEQVIAWMTKAEKFKINVLLHNNYDDIARKFRNIVETLEGKCYNER